MKTKLAIHDIDGKSAGDMNASAEIFAQKPNEHAVHAALVWYLAAQRRGTHCAKTRAEVRGGGKKPWRQKGTGRARAGTIRSPLWRKGGVIFPPKPRSYNYSLPKKARKLALKVALSDKMKEERVKVVDELKVPEIKTKHAAKVLKGLKVAGRVLVVMGKDNETFVKAARNLEGVRLTGFRELNILDLLSADWLVMEKSAVSGLEEVLI